MVNWKGEKRRKKRVKNVMVRFSEDEYGKVKENAEKVKMRVAEYCRASILMSQIKVVQSKKVELDQSVMINLYRIGVNLNQLLKYLNYTKARYMTYEEVLDAMSLLFELKSLYSKILEKLT
ncbi:MAG: hypothetical protein QXG39_05880 [Candidatus Aenigmatarchaeota archaeon]